MANAASPEVDFSAEGVRNFIIKHGGKVSNVAVVGHFMAYLRHPDKEVKEANRKKFKEIMNEVAVIKKDEKDEKMVVLKRKKKEINYGDFVDHPKLVIFKDNPAQQTPVISDPIPIEPPPTDEPARPPRRSDADRTIAMVTGPSVTDDGIEYTGPKEQGDVISTKEGERIIDQQRQIKSVKSFADIFDQEVQSQKEEVDRLNSPIRSPQKTLNKQETSEQNGEATRQDEGPGSLKDDETAPIISSGLQSSGTMLSISSEASTSCSTDTVMHWQQLEPLEHQWMMEAAKANLTALSNLLKQDITLAGKKDFITTALHWGAKHGKKEMIRLVADRGADVNCRSQGGYTALHIAAIHSKESVMQFLIQDYHADINIRDFSGRKARHYLKEGASSYMQQMMTGKPLTSPPRIRLMALAEGSPPEKRHHSIMSSIFGGSFRESIRNSFRMWGSADNLDSPDGHKQAPLSPKSKPKNFFTGIDYLMPPPAALPKSRTRSEINAPFARTELRKSESDPNIMESCETAYV